MLAKLSEVVFKRQAEPRENAFTLLVPEGWMLEGGIFRISPLTKSVQAQSAKIDMAVKSDAAGTRMLRFLPSFYYFDPRRSSPMMMGMFPVGSNTRGMLVYPVVPPQQFIAQLVFPYAHPGFPPNQVELFEQQDRPDLVQQFLGRALGPQPAGFTQAAGEVKFRYTENATRYCERVLALVQDMGPLAGGMWANNDTWTMRAPEAEFAQWEPIFQAVQASIKFNPAWIQEEVRAQQIASGILLEQQRGDQQRTRRALEIQRDIQAIDRGIVEHRQQTNAEIRNDHYLSLTNQEEYVNPYSGDTDTASNQWNYRWVTSDGREFYTDNENSNPNDDSQLNHAEWKRTPVRPRFPG